MAHRTTRRATMALAVICTLLGTPLQAQQATAAQTAASRPGAPTPGPTLRPEWRRVEPRLGGSDDAAAAYRKKDGVTIRMSTLVLVLCVIILVLLIA